MGHFSVEWDYGSWPHNIPITDHVNVSETETICQFWDEKINKHVYFNTSFIGLTFRLPHINVT